MEELVKFKAKIDRIIYPKNGVIKSGEWGLISCVPVEVIEGTPKKTIYGTVTVLGTFPELNFNDTYMCIGKYKFDEKYKTHQYEKVYFGTNYKLDTVEEQKIFLKNILTETQMNNLYASLENPFDAIAKGDIETLMTAKGIGVKVAERIVQKYEDNIDYSSTYVQLDGLGLSPSIISKLLTLYKSPDIIVDIIKNNPYVLIDEVDGIGWDKADGIALNNGYAIDDPRRIKAFISYVLEEQSENGNSWIAPELLLGLIKEKIGNDVDRKLLSQLMNNLHEEDILYWNEEKTKIALKKYYNLECAIAQELLRIRDGNKDKEVNSDEFNAIIKETEEEQGWTFTSEQLKAMKEIVENNLVILTGVAGSGKTSCLKGAINVTKPSRLAQTALSGKASSRMQEVTGLEGFTIHRLLCFDTEVGFVHNKDNPLQIDELIIDEVSMIGGVLFYQLLQAVPSTCKLIMVGDTGQLEAIGKLNVLKDMIDSKVVKHVNLTEIHRQALRSAIVTESYKVRTHEQLHNRGWIGQEVRGELKDFTLHCYNDKLLSFPTVMHHFKKKYEELGSCDDIHVLTCKREIGEISVYELNNAIQEVVNPYSPHKEQVELKLTKNLSYVLRTNDKVMIYKNNYKTVNLQGKKTAVFNGWVGRIHEIDTYESTITVYFEMIDDYILFEKKHWNTIMLGYSSTVHKFQGSQEKHIIMVVDFTGYMQLTKELIYTGITRASVDFTMCAETDALRYAVSQSNIIRKQTFLVELLQKYNMERLGI